MGLQTWLPSKPALSSMACLDVETPSICRVLQLCLQQRRTREQLVDQGIMPPLKTPAAFHEQIRSLERAKTGNFLKHKLCSRPQRSELVRMHILQESQAEASLQATQMQLKRARLTDDLNEKISQRPGPMELVEKNILPVEPASEEVNNGEKSNYSKAADVYSFDEDSSEALSPEQPPGQETPVCTSTSVRESAGTEAASSSSELNSAVQHSPPSNSQPPSDLLELVCTNETQSNLQTSAPQPITAAVSSVTPGPVLVKTLPKQPGDKSRSKKSKEPKPWVKKLKYHQYIPPDQKQELNDVPMHSGYARLLQQQQQFLQLQILNQQQQQYNYPAVLPATVKSATEVQTSCSTGLSGNAAAAPVQPRHALMNRKLDHLPANLDEMKVAGLKMELKRRSLPVSGTKIDLIERLKLYRETSTIQTAAALEASVATTPENIKLTPPVSPVASKVSSLGTEDSSVAESSTHLSDSRSPAYTAPCRSSPHRAPKEELATETGSSGRDSEKDQRLHEKERQIEELMRKLEQEQRLVEELKLQLEVEKRSQQGDSPPQLSPLAPIQVKEEKRSPLNCSAPCRSPGQPVLVKQEEAMDQSHSAPPNQFLISHQTSKQPEAPHSVQAGAQILLPATPPASALTIQLSANCIKLHTTVSSTAPGLIQTSGQVPQKIEASAALQPQCSTHTPPLTKTWRMDTAAQSSLSTFPVGVHPTGAAVNQPIANGPVNKSPSHCQPPLMLHQPTFKTHVSKCKDPPRYEDAVKQTRSMLIAVQGPTAASQQMDDLFDVLIESGEISPFIKQDPPSLDKPLPVTASVTTLPVNMVLSRPPAMVQVAQPPTPPLKPSSGLSVLISDTQLDSLLDCTLPADTEPQTLKLMEELHSPITMEVDFNVNAPPSAFTLHNANMDNMDNMDWLDLTLSAPAEGVNPLDMSTSVGVFSSDFLEPHELC
ncbi:myocardin-related transcription factor B isoform X1 [Platichthys flesus]|uniref:myocardin-related transcription factor B isoform X1 n=1 Tax=Platichthys flesus TaxID=8260 RepID=UPI002DB8F78A|nr:myocardin-related transcription factor B isoform X1 [Platichthys flesus]